MADEETKTGLLVPQEKYLASGIHIGTKIKTSDMKPFIFRTRKDGLNILDLDKINDRIRYAAKMLAKYDPKTIMVVASRYYSSNAAKKFGKITGIRVVAGRVTPGTFTNVMIDDFAEPSIVLINDPKGEKSALLEAAKMNITVIALCDTDNETKFVDLVVPCNNKGRKSLALFYYLLTRELLMAWGKIKNYDEFQYTPKYFEELEDEEEDVVSVKPTQL